MSAKGFSLIEIVLALAIVVLAVSVFAGGLLYGSDSLTDRPIRMQARWSVQECLHVARWIRDVQGLSALSEGTHGLTVTDGMWGLTGSGDTSGLLVRQMNVADAGAHDKDVTCTVTWQSRFGDRHVSAETHIAEWE